MSDVWHTVARIFSEANRREQRPFRYSFSGAGEECLRALVYDARDADEGRPPAAGPSELSWVLSSACGTAVGDALERAGVRLGHLSQSPALFEVGQIAIRGSSDTLAPGRLVIDWKLVGESKWGRITRAPDPKHKLQVNGYAVAHDVPRWALVYIRGTSIFDGSTTPEIKIYDGEADIELAQQLCGVWEEVEAHRKTSTLPERVFDASPNRFPCSHCRHLARCDPGGAE